MANGTFSMFRPAETTAAPAPTRTLSTPTAAMALARPVETTAAIATGAPLLGAEAAVQVPTVDIAAATRWYNNVLGPARTLGSPVTQMQKSLWDRFQAARTRITALVNRDGNKPVIRNYAEAMWRKWRELDLDGLAAYDRAVVPKAPARGLSDRNLTFGPRRYVDWFSREAAAARAAGQSTAASTSFAERRVMSTESKRNVFGFDISAAAAGVLAPGMARVVAPAVAPVAPAPARPMPMPIPGFAPPDVGPPPRPEPLMPPPEVEGLERYGDMIRDGALYGGGGAAAGALGAHLLKKSKGWGAVLGAGAGLALGFWLIKPFMERGYG